MAILDKKGRLRNSQADLDAFNAYCRSRVRFMKNSQKFLKLVSLEYGALLAATIQEPEYDSDHWKGIFSRRG